MESEIIENTTPATQVQAQPLPLAASSTQTPEKMRLEVSSQTDPAVVIPLLESDFESMEDDDEDPDQRYPTNSSSAQDAAIELTDQTHVRTTYANVRPVYEHFSFSQKLTWSDY